ncbi:MAG: NADP-dependent oxidoreductase [Thermoplasmata archaeon]
MKAAVVREFGDPTVLRSETWTDPVPGAGQVRIVVGAAGTNPVDTAIRRDGAWAGVRLPWIPGFEVAGTVDRVGKDAKGLAVGDRVVGMTNFFREGGGYAELTVLDAEEAVVLPTGVSFVAACAIPLAGGTAWDLLNRLNLSEGARLLVLGASGGVGSYLLQLAKHRGITVVAVGRPEHFARMRRLGAVECLDYGSEKQRHTAQEIPGGSVAAIADLVGEGAAASWLQTLGHGGQIASTEPPELDLGTLVDTNLTWHGVLLTHSGTRTRSLVELLGTGTLVSHVPHVFPLSRADEAHRLLETRHAGGKVVLVPPPF